MDASPLLPTFEIPLLRKEYFETDANRRRLLEKATLLFLNQFETHISKKDAKQFYIDKPKVVIENIASGDQFVSETKQVNYIC